VTCVGCRDQSKAAATEPIVPAGEVKPGQPGASLDREYARRKSNRERRTREAHPRVGGLLLAMRGTPQHELAFHQGAVAERAVADSLAQRTAGSSVITLHNRRMPGGRGDIDHIAIAPAGVYVIDTKDWQGNVQIQTPWFSAPRLLIRGRDRTKLIDGLERQITAVRSTLDRHGHHEIPIQGVLCFTKADLPFLRTQTFRGHLLLYRRALAKRLNASGPLIPSVIEGVARDLVAALPPAR
jgi:Nuclease-related domain